jgi:2-C-methyl-D-erythritol 2,4-cyclodiphosphate synthase
MTRMGIGYDIHAVASGRPLMLGCVHIEDAPLGLAGHSDADAVSHAVCDALLGAAALGDIGEHFPNTDAQWKDAPGSAFLAHVAQMVRALGYEIINIDCTVRGHGDHRARRSHRLRGHRRHREGGFGPHG